MSRLRVGIALAIVVGSLGWVMAKGLAGNLVYYVTPSDVVNGGEVAVGERVRLGGYVEPDSTERADGRTEFVVADGEAAITVVHLGVVPSLFRDGQGVVVEGALRPDGTFHSDTLLIKHDAEYAPPAPGETPRQADLEE